MGRRALLCAAQWGRRPRPGPGSGRLAPWCLFRDGDLALRVTGPDPPPAACATTARLAARLIARHVPATPVSAHPSRAVVLPERTRVGAVGRSEHWLTHRCCGRPEGELIQRWDLCPAGWNRGSTAGAGRPS